MAEITGPTLPVRITGDLSQFEATIARAKQLAAGFGAEARKAGNQADDGFEKAERQAKRTTLSIGAMAATVTNLRRQVAFLAGATGLGLLTREALRVSQATTGINIGFKAILGSSIAAQRELAFLRNTADELGVRFIPLAEGSRRLTASLRNTVLEGEATRKIFLSMIRAGRVLNLNSSEIGGALNALSQIAGKGTVSMEELRLQLGDRIPGALRIAAEGMGLTVAALIKLIETGNLASTEFLPKFAEALDKRFAKGAKDAAQTYQAATARVGTATDELLGRLGDIITKSPATVKALDAITNALKRLAGVFTPSTASPITQALERDLAILEGQLQALAQLRSEAVTFAGPTGETATERAAREALQDKIRLLRDELTARKAIDEFRKKQAETEADAADEARKAQRERAARQEQEAAFQKQSTLAEERIAELRIKIAQDEARALEVQRQAAFEASAAREEQELNARNTRAVEAEKKRVAERLAIIKAGIAEEAKAIEEADRRLKAQRDAVARSLVQTVLGGIRGEIASIGDALRGLTGIFDQVLEDMLAAAIKKNLKIPVDFGLGGTGGRPFAAFGQAGLGEFAFGGAILGLTAASIAQIQNQEQRILAALGAIGGGIAGGFFGGPAGAGAGASIGASFGSIVPPHLVDDIITGSLTSVGVGIPQLLDATGVSNTLFGTTINQAIGGNIASALGFDTKKPKKPKIELAIENSVLELVDGVIIASSEVAIEIVKARRTPGAIEEDFSRVLGNQLQGAFDETAEIFNQLPDVVREALIGPLQETFDTIVADLGELSFSGKDMVQEWQNFLNSTLPGELEDALGPIQEGAQIFLDGFDALESTILTLQRQQLAVLDTIQATRKSLAESILTPAQLLDLRQAELAQFVTAFTAGDPFRRVQLAPRVGELAQGVFTSGTQAFDQALAEIASLLTALETEIERLNTSIETLVSQEEDTIKSLRQQEQAIIDSQRSAESVVRVEQERLQQLLTEFDASTSADRVLLISDIQEQIAALNQAAQRAFVDQGESIDAQVKLLTIQNEAAGLLRDLQTEIGTDFDALIAEQQTDVERLLAQEQALAAQQAEAETAKIALQQNTLAVLDRLTLDTDTAFDSLISQGLDSRETLIAMLTGIEDLNELGELANHSFSEANRFLQLVRNQLGFQTSQFGAFAQTFEADFVEQFILNQTQIDWLTGIATSNLRIADALNIPLSGLVDRNTQQITILRQTQDLITESNELLRILADVAAPAPPPGTGGPPPTPPGPPPAPPFPEPSFQVGIGPDTSTFGNLPDLHSGFRWVLAFKDGQIVWVALGSGTQLPVAGFERVPSSLIPPGLPSGVPLFQSGTPFVPRTGPAILHFGEAVIPAHMNPFAGNAGGGIFGGVRVSITIGNVDATTPEAAEEFADRLSDQIVGRVEADLVRRERFGQPRVNTVQR